MSDSSPRVGASSSYRTPSASIDTVFRPEFNPTTYLTLPPPRGVAHKPFRRVPFAETCRMHAATRFCNSEVGTDREPESPDRSSRRSLHAHAALRLRESQSHA